MTDDDRKFIIINNGMKDLRGHYLETSVSMAEAAREVGFRPVLAAHVACDASVPPPELEFHPVFTVDYWMAEPPLPPLDRRGLRGELSPILATPVSALLDGTVSFHDYLAARFDMNGRAGQKRISRALSRGVQHVGRMKTVARRFSRLLHTARLYRRYRARYPKGAVAERPLSMPQAAQGSSSKSPGSMADLTMRFEAELCRVGAPQEIEYVTRFRTDLEQLLTFIGCSAHDHVFLPTAHGRELVAIHQLLQTIGPEAMPTFHLEFRHALTEWMGVRPGAEHPFCTLHKVCFQAASEFPATDRMRLYTDTDELAQQYHQVTGCDFDVLPIPFRAQLIETASSSREPLCLAFLGDARDEKGFHWLPDLVDGLMDDYVRPGHVRFMIQASPVDTSWNRGSCRALEKLRQYGSSHVQLMGTSGPLQAEEYFKLVSEADVLLCPFDAFAYRSRSSGTLAEAIAAGIPTIVPKDTWLARQQSPGAGETFQDLESFVTAVRRVCDEYPAYHASAQASKDDWLSFHTPLNLLKTLVTGTDVIHKAA